MPENKNTKNKKSFLLYLDYKEQFELLSDEQLGQLLRVIMEYEETGNVPEVDGMIKMAFSFIKAQLDRDKEKYEEKCQKNRENGSRGGRPKKEDTEEETKEEKPNGLENNPTVFEKSERFLEKPKKPDNDNDNDNDDDDDDDVNVNIRRKNRRGKDK